MAASRNAGKDIRAWREPPVFGTRAPTGRRRRIFVAAMFGAVTLTAMSVPAAVGAFSGEAVALTNSAATLSNAALVSTVSDNFDRADGALGRSEEHTSELQSHVNIVC